MEGLAETLLMGGTCDLQAWIRPKGHLVTLLGRGGSEVQWEEPSVKPGAPLLTSHAFYSVILGKCLSCKMRVLLPLRRLYGIVMKGR